MGFRFAVITVSDKGARGERLDTAGPALCHMLQDEGWELAHTAIVPDETERIRAELIRCADERDIPLVLTAGGTGLSPRDVTPEATQAVIEREVRGIPEAMRAESMRITPRGCLSRGVAGTRGGTLMVNLPGSEKAARECLLSVMGALEHGVQMLRKTASDCGASIAKVLAVCTSVRKGEQKRPVERAVLVPDYGIEGDAHAGAGPRQVSLLGVESVQKVQARVTIPLAAGAFAENILTEAIVLYQLPVGTKIRLGTAECEVSQIGKTCHSDCAIRQQAGDCVMPREGVFVRVLTGGTVQAGDMLTVLR